MSSAEDRTTPHTREYECPRCDADVLPIPQRCGFTTIGAHVPTARELRIRTNAKLWARTAREDYRG